MTKIDKNRVRIRKQKSGSQNRKVRQRKDAMEKSLKKNKNLFFQVKLKKQVMKNLERMM
ncbi:hypothetical protein RHGRI_008487 [Rhododendron griersonianum]|uniref:Uncharacterized protein n=1 Tax=Rhododendron griersonianum TaxID=479676 RepID=A0AAV6L2I9_9ERIC|nr:hypothetical protein RHGRI_008487 [Rhododendron griersonianum]